MISRLFKSIYFRNELEVFFQLKKHIHFNEKQKLEYQISKLQNVLSIGRNVPYYYRILNRLNIENLSYQEFSKLPLLTKDIIREFGPDLINKEYKNLKSVYSNTSGGSTGEPVEFMQTKEFRDRAAGSYHFANYLNGISPYDSMLIFWGALRDMHNTESNPILKRVKNFLLNFRFLNTFVLNDKIILSYIKTVNSYKPNAIKAYVHSFYEVSKYINRNSIPILCSPVIQTSTGPLYPEVKEEIQKAFKNSHIFSFYGSREVSSIATETPAYSGMNVLYDNVFLEVLDENGIPVKKGEEGEIVITTLNNSYMPLLRYRIGDRAIKGDNLEFGTLILQSVVGRTLGVIHRADGSKIDGQFFTSLFFKSKGIRNFQLIQNQIDSLTLKIVKSVDYDENEMKVIMTRIMEELPGVKVDLVFCKDIDLTATGKKMYVFSRL
ncbi:phenylacetate--CoA ligase family protein [Algoriphagus jejuensis]|uniref:Phenylacetate--CoA ligase family protein n=1 Tax=Algoriphagus jejuensis TaxID=419934 RepID=A0ABP3YKH4_9BACT